MDSLTRLLAELVAIPSVNPMGRSVTGPQFLEARLTDHLSRFFSDLGVRYERHTISRDRDNVLAFYDAPGSSRVILFDVHQDTVPVDGMTVPAFEPTISNGRMYGRGTCDVKGSMAAMLTAFARLVRERPAGSASVVLACTVDEEFTHTGSSALAAMKHGAELAIVAEPTSLDIVHAHKGALRWKIRTAGKACHSSTPHLGINAIYRMARVIESLEAYAKTLASSPADPILGPPSLSVGRIEGGQSVNIVPDWCEIEVDRRMIPGENADGCRQQVSQFLSTHFGSMDGIEFGAPWVAMPALAPHSSAWLEPLADAIHRSTGRQPKFLGVPFGTDAGPLSEAGTPCVVFGPGDIAQAHTKDEWVDLEEVKRAANAYFEIASSLGRRDSR